ncbi:mitochondrial uncoupling protein 4-like [Pollicipes pollicipes]|uniref:mitochondrial uncoupling protein 4-like n=1 Tax=Pollicipes pollicipes TaxID=41117 RepID=UPI001884EE6B|nr:mitochondrial uncoupling protein 4-like [Pollicipes pollicipes]XP_037074289.1 mitochondrial uncoupling protein 4-like [Pollicipes pollicipes]XP_037074290.1 mitochondrial uncoupling protein 4-like [Pollicipes pollicipes]
MAIGKMVDVGTADAVWFKYLLSCAAASCAEFATYPLDLTKTRLQIQGEAADSKVPYRGLVRTALGVVREEGPLRLWQGITPAIWRHVVYTGVRMNGYEWMRNQLREEGRSLPVWQAALGGLVMGGTGQLLASPADLVKVQMQMEGRRRLLGKKPRVQSAGQALRKIVREGGVRSLWKGCVPNVQRSALVNLGDLTTYDSVKGRLVQNTTLGDNHLTHFLASACSGLVSATLGTPADVVKTRVMNQPTDKHGRGVLYRNSIDCFLRLVQEEGLLAMYKGFVPCWLRMAPWSLTFWFTYENLRKFCGTSTF